VGGFVLTASGLFLPSDHEDATAREGVYGGQLGGRHGRNRRGVDKGKRRDRGERGNGKDGDKRNEKAPGAGLGPFRDTAITVINRTTFDLNLEADATFYYRVKTGLDNYGLPIEDGRRTISRIDVQHRYAPERFRVGVLVRPVGSDHAVYADVRNLAFDFPKGFVTYGANLNPPNGQFGQTAIAEQPLPYLGDWSADLPWNDFNRVFLRRLPDSKEHIEFSLTVE
jgi:hypothetical protein